ncbi:MAG TPA: hypothetical protein VIN63_09585 [Candidatus Limnocylindria bacterium]
MTITSRGYRVDSTMRPCGEVCGEVRGQIVLFADDDVTMMRGAVKAEGKEGVPEDRVAEVAIDFITFCLSRRAVDWPFLYDEMCYVASNRLYRGLGYEELREVGLDLALSGLVKTSRIANEVVRQVRIGDRPLRGGLLVAS